MYWADVYDVYSWGKADIQVSGIWSTSKTLSPAERRSSPSIVGIW